MITRKLAAFTAAAALTLAVAGCGDDDEDPPPAADPAPTTAATDDMDDAAGQEQFGPGCAAVPTDPADPGSFEAMAQVPVATAASGNPVLETLVTAVGEAGLGDSLNSADELLRRPMTERDITLNCVSSEVGGPYIGTARWLGVPLAPLLREAGIAAGADQLVARSVEGMTIGTPVETILDGRDALLAVGMNGQPLPARHGFPVRVLTPGLYGYAGSCKWLSELELTRFDAFDAYWVRRGWAERAPVKTGSRIDRPAPLTRLPAGPVTIAGVAWAQRRGIDQVQVSIDEQDWRPVELLPTASPDTWVQWRHRWPATPGRHSLRVRAVDGAGDPQTGQRTDPFPDGATGWHTITVTIE